jgi:CHASE2 domain-containing sensor protein
MAVLARLRHPALRGVWIGLVCAILAWLAVQWSLLRGVEDWMLDGCFSMRGTRNTSANIVIIALDAPSLAELKKPIASFSPELARVILFAHAQGAKAIGLDVMLPADREDLPALQPGEEVDTLTVGQAVVKTKNVTLPVWQVRKDDWLLPVTN